MTLNFSFYPRLSVYVSSRITLSFGERVAYGNTQKANVIKTLPDNCLISKNGLWENQGLTGVFHQTHLFFLN